MDRDDAKRPDDDPLAFLAGGGEMGARVRSFDWARTSLGPIEGWPQSLRSALSICLNSSFPIAIYWGDDLALLYNDEWSPIPGEKHPWALGRPAREAWIEIWEIIGPLFDQVVTTGEATRSRDQLLPMRRHGFTEECYFDYTFSPIRGEGGRVDGVFNAVIETTTRVIGERRQRTLRDLAAGKPDRSGSAEDACRVAARVFSENPHDLPFALLYLLDEDGKSARLAGASGLDMGTPASPVAVDLDAPDASWAFRRVAESGEGIEVDDLDVRFGPLPGGGWPESPRRAVILPMTRPGQARLAGFLVAGISPRLAFDDDYGGFADLLAGHVAAAIANARAYEQEWRRAEALAELDRAKTAFFSNVSHEFRTPLTLMLGPVEDLLDRDDAGLSAVARGQLEVVGRNGLRLLRLVNSLLDFSRIEAGRVRAEYRPTDLAAFTADLASVFRAAVEKAGLRLAVDCPPLDEPAFVDREMWEKVVFNLLSNAFKFTFEGEIAVTLGRVGDAAELRVRDTGIGIPAGELPRLFERFHRVENARGRTHEGSGIGLALVQELVKLHGGSIAAESVVGEGTTFVVAVPLGSAHLPTDQVGEASHHSSMGMGASPYVEEALRWLPDEDRGGDYPRPGPPGDPATTPDPHPDPGRIEGDDLARVLVADDNADMRRYVARLLAGRHRVEAVSDGEAALAAARDRPPDLILTDVMMPRLDGFGLLRGLRADPRTRGVPVIMLSARAGEESRVEGMEAGADDYLVKPFGARELLARVSAHLQIARLRREAGESLRRGEERLRMALTAARMVAWQWNPADGSLHVSENAPDVFGLPEGTGLVGIDQGLALLHPDDVEGYRETFARAIEERGSYLTHYRLIRPDDGRVLWMEERGHAVCDPSGEVARLAGVVMDITEAKHAEEGLRHARSRLESTLSVGEIGTWEFDVARDVVTADRNLSRIYGVTPEGPMEGPVELYMNIIHPEDRDRVLEAVDRALESGETYEAEYRLVLPDRSVRWVIARARVVRDEAGGDLRMPGVVVDITGQKRAEQQLQESQERLRFTLQAGRMGTWDLDLASGRLTCSETCKANYGRGPSESFTYDELASSVLPEDRPIWRRAVDEAVGRTSGLDVEYRTRWPDGSVHWVCVRASCAAGEDGRTVAMSGVSFVIDDRKRAEEALIDADRRKDEFLATLAHELRNPLAPIRNGLQIMKMAADDPRAVGEARTLMERQVTHMVRLIDDLMDVSRITRGKMGLRRERVELATVVRNAVETSRPLVEDAGHELSVTLPARPILVDADATRLAQVFSNLLNNAAKYTERGGDIALVVERQGSDVVVTVRDNGVGIPPEMLPEVFAMFTQVDRSLERSQGGLGIGLSLVKTLVEMHGGSVEARSGGHGLGSEFVVRLPIVLSASGQPAPPEADDQSTGPAPRFRILVVDDNHDSARTLARLLKLLGHEARMAHDGGEAVDVAEGYRPELMLLDIGLPVLNGYDVARAIRGRPWGRDVRIIALTGWGQEEDRRRSKEAGIDDHLVKPVDPALLEKLLAESRPSPA